LLNILGGAPRDASLTDSDAAASRLYSRAMAIPTWIPVSREGNIALK
jgi:hypothetical protein